MTLPELLLDLIGEVKDEFIQAVDKRIATVKSRKRVAISSLAAVFVIAVTAIVLLIAKGPATLDMGANANYGITGVAIEDNFYIQTADGIYRYTPQGKTKKLVNINIFDNYHKYAVNGSGLYYTQDNKTVKRIDHDSNNAVEVYSCDDASITGLSVFSSTDISVVLQNLNKNSSGEVVSSSYETVVINGKTGLEKSRTQHITYDESNNAILSFENRTDYTIGDRTIRVLKNGDGTYHLSEDKKASNDESFNIDTRIKSIGPVYAADDYLIFAINNHFNTRCVRFYIARADGNDTEVVCESPCPPQGNDEYFFNIDDDGNLECISTQTGKTSILANDEQLSYCDFVSNGEYICIWHRQENTPEAKIKCYKILYNTDGVPYDIELVEDDVIK